MGVVAGRLQGDQFSSPGESPTVNINCLIGSEKDRLPPERQSQKLCFVSTVKTICECC